MQNYIENYYKQNSTNIIKTIKRYVWQNQLTARKKITGHMHAELYLIIGTGLNLL